MVVKRALVLLLVISFTAAGIPSRAHAAEPKGAAGVEAFVNSLLRDAVAHRQLTAKERQLIEKPVLVHVGIVLSDGTPHISAMWVDLDGEDILLNTAEGRTKANALRLGSPVALSVLDPENPYRNLGLRGHVVQVISEEQGAGAGINRLPRSTSEWKNTRIAPRESDGCSSGCDPRSSAVGAKTSLSGFAGNSGAGAEFRGHNTNFGGALRGSVVKFQNLQGK